MVAWIIVAALGTIPASLGADGLTVTTPAGMVHLLALVPAGEFVMGADGGNRDEGPAHSVFLDAYFIDRLEVTNAQFVAFLNAVAPSTDDQVRQLLDLGDPDVQIVEIDGAVALKSPELEKLPAVEVSWYGAQAYCKWAGLRLPTEAEWEKAARGGDRRTYPWGETIDFNRANYGGNPGRTTDVGSHPGGISPHGVQDMAGNVWEWVGDLYKSDWYSFSSPRNPRGPLASRDRGLRGGAWNSPPSSLRASYRRGAYPSFTDSSVGFRCACDPAG